MDDSLRLAASQQICNAIADRTDFQAARNVAVFLPFDGEPDLKPLIATAWAQGQRVFLPIVLEKGQPMRFTAYDRTTQLVPNQFGILEPDPKNSQMIEPAELDYVLTPLVAFDAECHRVGVGGGFYDRTFAFKRTAAENKTTTVTGPLMVGVAFELQKITAIDPQSWDVPLDAVVTENQTYSVS